METVQENKQEVRTRVQHNRQSQVRERIVNSNVDGTMLMYIIAESGALYASTGASRHIEVGLRELSKTFNVTKTLFCNLPVESLASSAGFRSGIRRKKSNISKLLSWIKLLLRNHRQFLKYYKLVKNMRPALIYERAGYLNYNGIIIARMLRIPHFYEVNGIAAHDHEKYFPGVCNKLSFILEKWAYTASTLGFYVGGIQHFFGLPKSKALTIQNGIDETFIEPFAFHSNIAGKKLRIVFIGTPMHHHRLDLLVEALHNVDVSKFSMHFIGPDLSKLREKLPAELECTFYGPMTHQELAACIGQFNIGIIPYALDYFSHVKLFMYGAAKLLVILPETKNFQTIFDDSAVVFVRNGNATDIAEKLSKISADPSAFWCRGDRLHQIIRKNYTWEKIYADVTDSILEKVPEVRHAY